MNEAGCFQKRQEFPLKIAIVVLALHLVFMLVSFFYQIMEPPPKKTTKIVVQTISLSPKTAVSTATETLIAKVDVPVQNEIVAIPQEQKQPEPKPVEQKQSEPKKKPEVKKPEVKKPVEVKKPEVKKMEVKKPEVKPQVKKPEVKPQVKKIEPKPAPKPEQKPVEKKPVEKKPTLTNEQKELLQQAGKNLAKIDKPVVVKKNQPVAPVVPLIGELSVDAVVVTDGKNFTARELGYRDELSLRLKALLKLPEHGEVQLKLTLGSTGKVLKVIIENFESEKNRKYIENEIKASTFPSFHGNFGNASEYTFSVTLK